jgi:hypothetical protein
VNGKVTISLFRDYSVSEQYIGCMLTVHKQMAIEELLISPRATAQ